MNFLVIGAQKAATSWIYRCLKDHPEIELPPTKYEAEYLGGNLSQVYGSDWYDALIPSRAGAVRGDVSVEYLFDPRSPRAVHDHAPEVKLIAVLREPIDRAISAYAWSRRDPAVSTHMPTTAEETFRRILDPGYEGSPLIKAQLAELVTRGFYDSQLARWLDVFHPEAFFVLTYDAIRKDPAHAIGRIYDFLGASSEFLPDSLERRPKRTNYAVPEHAQSHRTKLTRIAVRAYGKLKSRMGSADTHAVFALSDETRERLRAVYASHIQRTDELLQKLPADQRPDDDLMSLWGYATDVHVGA